MILIEFSIRRLSKSSQNHAENFKREEMTSPGLTFHRKLKLIFFRSGALRWFTKCNLIVEWSQLILIRSEKVISQSNASTWKTTQTTSKNSMILIQMANIFERRSVKDWQTSLDLFDSHLSHMCWNKFLKAQGLAHIIFSRHLK